MTANRNDSRKYILTQKRQKGLFVLPLRDVNKCSRNLLIESNLESFMKTMIERNAALSIQNALDIADVISPHMGIEVDMLKSQVTNNLNGPSEFIENLLKLLTGDYRGDMIRNNIILENMKRKQSKSLEIIRKCLLEDVVNEEFTYDAFNKCIRLYNSGDHSSIYTTSSILTTTITDNSLSNSSDYNLHYQKFVPSIDENHVIITKKTLPKNIGNQSNKGKDDSYNKIYNSNDDDDDDNDPNSDDDNDDDDDDSLILKNDNENNSFSIDDDMINVNDYIRNIDLIKNVVNRIKTLRGTINIQEKNIDDDAYLFHIVKNITNKSQDILLLGKCLRGDTQLNDFQFEPEHYKNIRAIEDMLGRVENMIHSTYSKGESQLGSIGEITLIRLFFKNILLQKTAMLVYQYRVYLAFMITFSLTFHINHNIRIDLNKKNSYKNILDMKKDQDSNKYKLVEISIEDSIFILSVLHYFIGSSFHIFLYSIKSYDAAIDFIDKRNSEKKNFDTNISYMIDDIYKQLEAREAFLLERNKDESINPIIDYMLENRESDILLNPLHHIILNIGNVIKIIVESFRELFLKTAYACHIIHNVL
uniref:Uncharacterized protein n=1 Tax=Trachysalambria curvirostris majanivirus TaxID=2984281 RepID=A0A9C7CFP0_9VIRU|nr:MAG: hypothetical protein [Trachysalambria curvirostris majanivirus]